MSDAPNPFVDALSAHDGPTLSEAFERANQTADRTLHRTTLTRWKDGSLPQDEAFVRVFADELDDDNIFEAWKAARGTRTSTAAKSIVTRYAGLSPEDKKDAYVAIRRLYLEESLPPLYDRLSYRVEINDARDSDDYLVVRMQWAFETDDLPENVHIQIVTSFGRLSEAYERPNCLFRDLVAFQPQELQTLLEGMPPPVLTYNSVDRLHQRMIRHEGRLEPDGILQFDNDVASKVRLRLTLDYPWPRNHSTFPIRFPVRVAGGAQFTLVLNAHGVSDPQAFAFPPDGRQREWAVDRIRPNELEASLGGGGTVLGDGDGLVLMWSEET